MCDRCGAGLMFFGLAEPQAAMLESYKAALRAGWSPASQTSNVRDTVGAIDADPAAFIAALSDDVDQAPARLTVTRWMWDGEFCGELRLQFDARSPAACSTSITCVAWKAGHDYETRARRQVFEELRALGVEAAALAALFDAPVSITRGSSNEYA